MEIFHGSFLAGLSDAKTLVFGPFRFRRVLLLSFIGLLAGSFPLLEMETVRLGWQLALDSREAGDKDAKMWNKYPAPEKIDDFTSLTLPVEMLNFSRKQVIAGNHREAAVAFHMAACYMEYDSRRVRDIAEVPLGGATYQQKAFDLPGRLLKPFISAQFGDNEEKGRNIEEAIARLGKIGPPQYYPSYLIGSETVEKRFTDADSVIIDIDVQAEWNDVLATLPKGSMDSSVSLLLTRKGKILEGNRLLRATKLDGVGGGWLLVILLPSSIVLLRLNAVARFVQYGALVSSDVLEGGDVQVLEPRRRWARQINSFFLYNLALCLGGGVFLWGLLELGSSGLGGMVALGDFGLTCLLSSGVGLFLVLNLYLGQFGTAIMAKDGTTVLGATKTLIGVASTHPFKFALYLPHAMLVGAFLCIGAAVSSAAVIVVLYGVYQVVGGIGYVFPILGPIVNWSFLAAGALGVLFSFGVSGVFFRLCSLHYLSQMEPQHDVFSEGGGA